MRLYRIELLWARGFLWIGQPRKAEHCCVNALTMARREGAPIKVRLAIATCVDRVRAC